MIRTIVIPLDGSPLGEQALEPAVRIAGRLHAGLELVSVYEPQLPAAPVPNAPQMERRLDAELRASLREYLEAIARAEQAAGAVRVNTAVLQGDVVDALARHIASLDDVLVVMMARRRTGLTRLLGHSLAERLVRATTVPLLAMTSRGDAPVARPPGAFGHVLVPLEGPEIGTEIVERAVDVAGTAGVDYELASFVNPYPVLAAPEPVVAVPPIDADALQAAAHEFLERIAAPLRARGIHVVTRVEVHDDPAGAILELARTHDIDLVAMATHGYRGLVHLMLGSVAERVLDSAPVPVLLLRAPVEHEGQPTTAGSRANAAR